MAGWGYDGRKMTLNFEHHSETYVYVTDDESKDIGGFMLFLSLLMCWYALMATTEAWEHGGHLVSAPFAEGLEIVMVPLYFAAVLYAVRAGVGKVLLLTGIAFVAFSMAIGFGREALENRSSWTVFLMFATWPVGLLIAFALLRPYPLWQGLMIAYLLAVIAPLGLLSGQIDKDADRLAIVFAWVAAAYLFLFGATLRGLHSYQQDREGAHFVRHGD